MRGILAVVYLALGGAYAYAAPDVGPKTCGEQFSSSEFQNSNIKHLIKQYTADVQPNAALAASLAGFGGEVVPYMARLDCRTKLRFYFMNPKAGAFGFYHDRVYTEHAHEVISKISDPAAIPNLRKLFFEPRLDQVAQDAVVRLSAREGSRLAGESISKELMKEIIDRDASRYSTRYNVPRYLVMARRLSKEDQLEVLFYLFDSKRLAPGLSYSTGAGAGKAFVSELDIDNWKVLVQVLGRTKSPAALSLLRDQYSSLRKNPAAAPNILQPVLAAYEIALDQSSGSGNPIETDTWILPLDLESVPYASMTTQLTAIVSSISIDGKLLIDAEGKSWNGRSVELTERDGPRFYKHVDIVFHTKSPQSEKPLALVSVIDPGRGKHVENLIECIPSGGDARIGPVGVKSFQKLFPSTSTFSESFAGEVGDGQVYERQLKSGLWFQLRPKQNLGYIIWIGDKAHPEEDYCSVVTPPFHGANDLDIWAPQLASEDYARLNNQPGRSRAFRCVNDRSSYLEADWALHRVLWPPPAGEPKDTSERAQRLSGEFEKNLTRGHLKVNDVQVDSPDGGKPSIKHLKFEVSISEAKDPRRASEAAQGAPGTLELRIHAVAKGKLDYLLINSGQTGLVFGTMTCGQSENWAMNTAAVKLFLADAHGCDKNYCDAHVLQPKEALSGTFGYSLQNGVRPPSDIRLHFKSCTGTYTGKSLPIQDIWSNVLMLKDFGD